MPEEAPAATPDLSVRAIARHLLTGEMARGTTVNLGFAVVNSFLGLVTSIFAGNALGPAGIGILSLGILVSEFASTFDNLGTGGFMRDYAAEPSKRKLATIYRVKAFLNILTAGVLVLLAYPLGAALDIPPELLLILAIIPLTSVFSSIATMVHEARRRPWQRNASGVVEAVVKTLLYGGFWLILVAEGDVLLFAWGAVVASLVGEVAGAFLVPWQFRGYDAGTARYYVRFGAVQQLGGILDKVIFWVDILLIDIIISHYVQGQYRIAYSVMALVPFFAGTVGIFLYPALSDAHTNHGPDAVRRLFLRGAGLVLTIALPLVAAVVVLADVAMGLFGPEFADAAWMLRALALVALLPAAMVPFGALFPAMDRPGVLLRITAVMVVVNVLLDLVLVPVHGPGGAIVATATTYTLGLVLAIVSARRLGVLGKPPEVAPA